MWNMKMTVIPIAVNSLGTVPKGLEKMTGEIENQRKNYDIQTIALLRFARIFRESWRLGVIQTPEKDHLLKMVWKTCND